MAEALVDTTILVDLARGHEPARAWLRECREKDRLAVSVLTWFELLAGCRNRREELRLDRMLGHFQVIPVVEADCQVSLRWYRRFHLSDGVGALDCLIAASSSRLGVPLLSANLKHFRKLPGVVTKRPY
ncbi:MAG: type II toxin-antitoxin system VapC family toxin [Candidatus Riflebacteria bacterium]|nr:type II toxin-antitoxin system VapC family toxin [Candidatus Riflebacteria bacterium]